MQAHKNAFHQYTNVQKIIFTTSHSKLIQNEPTRWNSLFQTMRRLPEQKQAITLAASNPSFNVDITPQCDAIKQLIDVLDVFEGATILAGGSAVTVS